MLAFDFGTKRIGVAVGDAALQIAHPLPTITFEDKRRRLDAIAELIHEWRPAHLVVGIPCSSGEHEHPLAARIRRFAQRLRARFGLPVDLVDEHLSSWEASHRLLQSGIRKAAQKPLVDAMAACVILQTWFEDRPRDAGSTNAER